MRSIMFYIVLVSYQRIRYAIPTRRESEVFQEFEDARKITEEMPVPF